MAKKELVENIVKLYSKLGGNMNDVLGSRSNVTFLGTGRNPEPFVEMDINMEAVGALGKSKILKELKSPMGYLTADKLNDVQATKLYNNMLKLEEFYYPKQISNIIDLGPGTGVERTITRNLDQEGLGALRARGDYMTDEGVMASETILPTRRGTQLADDLPPPGSRGGPDDIAAPIQSAEETIKQLRIQDPDLADQVRKMVDQGIMGVSNKGDMPAKRSSAREFLVEALKKDEYDVGTAAFGKVNLNNVISAEDVKFITEGGGGIGGDPIVLVEKYFGPRIAEALPAGATGDEIIRFTNRVLENVTDAAGLKPDNPKFDRMTAKFIDEMADGGRAGFKFGRSAGKAFGLAKKLANINKSVDEGTPMGYGALREYGIEAEDITNLFKKIAMDKTLVGQEKTAYFKQLNKVLKNPDDYPDFIKEIKIKLGIGLADGGRAGFKFGKTAFQGIANMFKTRGDEVLDISKKAGDFKNQEQTFRTGPITMDFLEKVDPAITKKFIRTRDTSGPGSYGMYSSLSDMPQGLQAAEFIKNVRTPGGTVNYELAEMYIGGGVKLSGKESMDELLQMFLNAVKQPLARGGLAKILEV
jgi:hypothetical protein